MNIFQGNLLPPLQPSNSAVGPNWEQNTDGWLLLSRYRFYRVQFLNIYTESVFYPLECADARAGVKLCGLTGLERGQVFHTVLMETSAFVTWRAWCSVQWCHLQSSWSRCPDSRMGQLWGPVSQQHTKWVKHSRQKGIQPWNNPWNNSCLLQFLAYV